MRRLANSVSASKNGTRDFQKVLGKTNKIGGAVVHRSWDPVLWATSPYLIGNGTEIRCFQGYPEIVEHCPWTFLSQMIPVKSLLLLLKTQLGGGWKLGSWSNQAFSLTLDQHGRVLEGHQHFFKTQRTRPSTAFFSSVQELLKFRYCRR